LPALVVRRHSFSLTRRQAMAVGDVPRRIDVFVALAQPRPQHQLACHSWLAQVPPTRHHALDPYLALTSAEHLSQHIHSSPRWLAAWRIKMPTTAQLAAGSSGSNRMELQLACSSMPQMVAVALELLVQMRDLASAAEKTAAAYPCRAPVVLEFCSQVCLREMRLVHVWRRAHRNVRSRGCSCLASQ